MRKANRKRSHNVSIWMDDEEYNYLKNAVKRHGISQQSFIINAVYGAKIISSIEIAVLIGLSKTFADLERQLRGMATNINQIARIANTCKNVPASNELNNLSSSIEKYRKESERIWRSIRSLIGHQRPTEP